MGESHRQLVVGREGAIVVATLQRRYPSDEDVEELRAELRQVLEDQGVKDVVLDFQKVEFFDANLRGQLAWLHRELAARGGRLAVCSLGAMWDHPTLVQFAAIMTVVSDLPEAVAALRVGQAEATDCEKQAAPSSSAAQPGISAFPDA